MHNIFSCSSNDYWSCYFNLSILLWYYRVLKFDFYSYTVRVYIIYFNNTLHSWKYICHLNISRYFFITFVNGAPDSGSDSSVYERCVKNYNNTTTPPRRGELNTRRVRTLLARYNIIMCITFIILFENPPTRSA